MAVFYLWALGISGKDLSTQRHGGRNDFLQKIIVPQANNMLFEFLATPQSKEKEIIVFDANTLILLKEFQIKFLIEVKKF
ncbi:hypothetical protein ACO0K9_13695 [Undibacterium sp. Ji50W]|uniref:hypothetical protein n=1 Tax=Undibacterium sp. Ji50W TaxID=3413041 RepID=UPI003BF10F7C